jgi:ornithine cyclodeaminase
MSVLLLNEDELRQIVTIAEAINSVKSAFIASAEGRVNIPGDFSLNLPDVNGKVQVKSTYLNEAPYYVVKVNSSFQDNPTLNLPIESGLLTVFDAATGFPAAIMVDNGYLTGIRAGAAGALAAQYLANQKLSQVAIIGSGNQAYMQLKSLLAVRKVEHVLVWAPSPANVDRYARSMVEDHDLNIDIAPSVEAAVRAADLIITATRSRQPLIQEDWLKPGVHITAVGSNSAGKQELHIDVLARADVLIADNFSQCSISGEIHHALEAGVITPADVQGELGDLIIGKIKGRTDPDQITVADLTGLDMQDTAIATLALDKALFLGLGQRVATQLSI